MLAGTSQFVVELLALSAMLRGSQLLVPFLAAAMPLIRWCRGLYAPRTLHHPGIHAAAHLGDVSRLVDAANMGKLEVGRLDGCSGATRLSVDVMEVVVCSQSSG